MKSRTIFAFLTVVAVSAIAVPPAFGEGDRPDGGEADSRPELKMGRTPEYDYDPPAPGTYELPVIKAAGDGDVLTPNGKSRRLRDILSGKITILSFIYTRCADPTACPIATGALYRIHKVSEEDPAIADKLQLVTFSFDPEHDTPTVMKDYSRGLSPGDAGSRWLFLTTAGRDDLEPILEAYGQRVDRKSNAADRFGPFFHILRVYLVDDKGMIRNIYSFGLLDPRMVLTDVRTLLAERATAARN